MKRAGMLHPRALKRECGLPATGVNAASTTGFPHCGKGTDRGGRRLGPTGSKLIEELTMAERKTAGKMPRKRPAKRSARKAGSARRTPAARAPSSRRWSQRVTEHSDALDLEQGVFKLTDPKKIAASLKRSAERSSRRKAGAYRSALSMLTFISTAPARACRRRSGSGWSGPRAN
jgi:hypothetical protein